MNAHLPRLIQQALIKHHISWPLIDTLESAYLFYNPMRADYKMNLTEVSLANMVIIKMELLLNVRMGLLLHNHPDGRLAPSDEDLEFALYWRPKLPDVYYGVIAPNFDIILYDGQNMKLLICK